MHKVKYLLVILFLCPAFANCQEQMGIANSNYSPTSSVFLNPSSTVDSKVLWEFSLVNVSVFADNDYVFLPNTSARAMLLNTSAIPKELDDYTTPDKYGYVDVAVQGPSMSFNVGKHAFGINTQVRSVTDARNVPYHLAKFAFEGFEYTPQRGIVYSGENMKVNSMTWGEVGLNYGLIFKKRGKNMYMAGASLKRLYGISHTGINIKNLSYQVPDTLDVDLVQVTGKYGLTEPSFDAGRGWGFDLGFTYKKTLKEVDRYVPYSKQSGCIKSDYKYKLGVSILDIGRITYNTEAYYGEFEDQPGTWKDYNNITINSIGDVDEKLDNSFVKISNKNNKYKAYLPTALSVQYDYNFENGFYINTTLVQNLSFFNQLGVIRQNLLAVTPRLELSRFEVSLPISLRRYLYPSVGLAFRFWNNIIIGTDRLFPLIHNQDVYGMDIYVGIKLAKLYTNKCNKKYKPLKQKKYKTNACYYKQRY